jgi:hypothetical protein
MVVMFAALFMGCTSIKAAVPPSERAGEYRQLQTELQRQQTDSAISGQKLEEQGRGLVEDLSRLEDSMVSAPEAGEAERRQWLTQVRTSRAAAEAHLAEIENLNQMLQEERETSAKKDHLFNEYDAAMTSELSVRATENAALREELTAVKGQRNTVAAILITAAVVVILTIVVKILRTVRIIPM